MGLGPDMDTVSSKESFTQDLGNALAHLYDPNVLRRSPLLSWFGLEGRSDAMLALQRILTEAIESLKPDDGVPHGSNAWRVYHVLYYRYTEQFMQHEVATDLGLSTRQVRRQERTALQVLADYLWSYHALEHKAHLVRDALETEGEDPLTSGQMPSREQELAWLERTVPNEWVDVQQMLSAVLETALPVARSMNASLTCDIPENLPALNVQRTTAQQAFLHIVTAAMRCASGGSVQCLAEALPQSVRVRIQSTAQHDGTLNVDKECTEALGMARELLEMSGGSLQATPDPDRRVLAASVTLPAAEQIPVLIIEDNIDVLKLMERYLSGGRYRFVGVSDPHEALTQSAHWTQAIIVLDVMLPEVDGWELLGRLREHPATSSMPIIVCTILPHQQLALTLGAADFIRKPVSRQSLLDALDKQASRLLTGSRSHS